MSPRTSSLSDDWLWINVGHSDVVKEDRRLQRERKRDMNACSDFQGFWILAFLTVFNFSYILLLLFVCDAIAYTGWLKLKYPTGQNAISRQPCEIFIPKFLGFMGEILLQF